jgi:hypothetical protein
MCRFQASGSSWESVGFVLPRERSLTEAWESRTEFIGLVVGWVLFISAMARYVG